MSLPPLDQRTLRHAFERVVAQRPNDIAHVFDGRAVTFAQSFFRSKCIGGAFQNFQISRGDAVAMLLDNHLDAVHLQFGLGLAGIVQTPINTAYKGSFLAHVINDCRTSVLVIEADYIDRLVAIADDVPNLKTVIVRGGGAALPASGRFNIVSFSELERAAPVDPVEAAPSDIQGYFYTSGTSGPSKGVRVTYAQAYTFASREDDPRSSSSERILVVLPLFHIAGQLYGVYQALIAGAACVLAANFSVSGFWSAVRQERITTVLTVGAMAELIYQQSVQEDDGDNPLELVISAPLMSDPKGFSERFKVAVGVVYGITEFGCPIVGRPEQVIGGECGFARDGFICKVVDEHDVEVPRGTVGELVIRSELPWTLSDGYLGLPEATANQRRNLWGHTGDAFRQDKSGRFYFVDRIKDAIRRRGENVSSFEVEACVNQFPAVLESAAVAVPSSISEDEILIYVVPRSEQVIDPAELIEFLGPRMPYFCVPRYVEVIESLPKTPTNKVQKSVLRGRGIEAAWDRDAAGIVVNRRSWR